MQTFKNFIRTVIIKVPFLLSGLIISTCFEVYKLMVGAVLKKKISTTEQACLVQIFS